MLIGICILLGLLLIVVSVQFWSMKRELRRMAVSIETIHGQDTNQRLTVASTQKEVMELANAINVLYDDVYERRAAYTRSMTEMQQNMASISHDLRTPLTSILGYLKLLQEGSFQQEKVAHYLSVAYSKAQTLHSLIDNLFMMARLDAGAFSFVMELVAVDEILAEELAAFYEVLSANGQPPSFSLSSEPLHIMGDRQGIARVCSNLLQNMVTHSGKKMAVASERRDGQVVLHFSNQVDLSNLVDVSKLFHRFYIGDPVRSKESTGLGLSIVEELVKQMGGGVSAELQGDILTITAYWPSIQ